tara:strand:+ start:256 stop:627 length:372 start_codon:yes stop_codon:yes gene_type:complete
MPVLPGVLASDRRTVPVRWDVKEVSTEEAASEGGRRGSFTLLGDGANGSRTLHVEQSEEHAKQVNRKMRASRKPKRSKLYKSSRSSDGRGSRETNGSSRVIVLDSARAKESIGDSSKHDEGGE